MRKVLAVRAAPRADVGELVTRTAFTPDGAGAGGAPDPFLLLNHHGPQGFPAGNAGLPFGPHPHRGFEKVTFILEGELLHADTTGCRSRIFEGGIQWMTAGGGLIHAELSPPEFKPITVREAFNVHRWNTD